MFQTVKQFLPNVVLLDIILPKRDGFAVLKALKSDSKTKKAAVILLTNLGQDDDINKGMDLGAESYLTKTNCTPKQIVSEITKVMEKKKGGGKKKDTETKKSKKQTKKEKEEEKTNK
jgi:DNA-binding response OmpR family regulator